MISFRCSPKADLKKLVQGNNEFAFDLCRRLAQKEGNIIFSPYSISNALAMTYSGARGETAEQMAKVLHFTLGQERLHPAFGELITDLQKKEDKDRPCHLHVANSLWGQRGSPFLDAFVQLTQKNYGAGLKEVDFKRGSEEACKSINAWVEGRTNQKTKEWLVKGDVDKNTRFVLTNAIYFKAGWKYLFPDDTKEAPFAMTVKEEASVQMMQSHRRLFKYHAGSDFEMVELPYWGDLLSMVLLLPRKRGALAEAEKKLTAVALQDMLMRLEPRQGEVMMPRFTMTYRVDLVDELKRMGLVLPFGDKADFSGMVSEQVFISRVIHKAYMDVNEGGTEAAAATATVGTALTAGGDFFFLTNCPFLFLIRDNQTGSVLFLGRVEDPRT